MFSWLFPPSSVSAIMGQFSHLKQLLNAHAALKQMEVEAHGKVIDSYTKMKQMAESEITQARNAIAALESHFDI